MQNVKYFRFAKYKIIAESNAECGSILDEKSGLRSHERGNRTLRQWLLRFARKSYGLTKRVASLPDLSLKDKRILPNHHISVPSNSHSRQSRLLCGLLI
ncbi:hypothetical protein [Helicobacter sp. 23-1045]